ncbi:MAG: hypothetical protein WC285_00910 [Candidatus Gracilibacteria bacterium]|jgi:hypothetical protein
MGTGKIYNLHETDDTRRSGAEEAFEEILRKVKANGGEISKDETIPLYTDIGDQEAQIGEGRIVEFSLGRLEFQMIRKIETDRITGAGRQKSLEPMTPPRVSTILKRKDSSSQDWQVVDLEAML